VGDDEEYNFYGDESVVTLEPFIVKSGDETDSLPADNTTGESSSFWDFLFGNDGFFSGGGGGASSSLASGGGSGGGSSGGGSGGGSSSNKTTNTSSVYNTGLKATDVLLFGALAVVLVYVSRTTK
jgi:hypothetical protein